MILVELRQLLRRPRTWISLGILVALPVTIAIFLAVTHIAPRPGEGPALLSQVLSNGTLFAAAALAVDLALLLPLSVLVVAGDSIAGEANNGTLRYLLVRPVGRTRLIVAKLLAIVLYVAVAVGVVSLAGYLVGIAAFPSSGSVVTLSGGVPLTPGQTSWRIAFSIFYVGFSMLGVAAFALMLSTMSNHPLAAALGGFAALVASTVLDQIDATRSIKPYLPTHYWFSFVDLFRNPVLWRDVERGLLLQTVYVVVMLFAAWAYFTTRDVTS